MYQKLHLDCPIKDKSTHEVTAYRVAMEAIPPGYLRTWLALQSYLSRFHVLFVPRNRDR